MIVKGYITATLEELEALYNRHQSVKKDIYYSKLALLELCGWIEESFDSIAKTSVNKNLKTDKYRGLLKEVIKYNHGFQYNGNFVPMLMKTVGLQKIERVEVQIGGANVQVLSTVLGNLKKIRNDHAHTFIRGTTTSIQSPSVTNSQFLQIYRIIKDFERKLKT